jgi:voltage-gated potassium channel Kch
LPEKPVAGYKTDIFMKLLPTVALLLFSITVTQAGSLGPGPWSSGAYYPGGTDGKYQAAAYGNNITGVIGFAIREGGPTVLQQQQQQQQQQQSGTNASAASASISAATAAAQAFDATQNYFVIFVEGRTYSGLAVGSVNPVGKTVTGALLGAQPDFGFVTNNLPFEFPPTEFVTNEVVSVIGSNPVISIQTLPGTTVTNVTNTVTTNIAITNIGDPPTTFTFEVITTNTFSNVVVTDPTYITNTNFSLVFQTNTNVAPATFGFSVSGIQATTNTFDTLPILNRGLSGGFQAKLKNKKAYMTFRGDGELSTPAQGQTVDLATNAAGDNISGTIETHTVSFKVDGLRTSFLTTFTPTAPTTSGTGTQ